MLRVPRVPPVRYRRPRRRARGDRKRVLARCVRGVCVSLSRKTPSSSFALSARRPSPRAPPRVAHSARSLAPQIPRRPPRALSSRASRTPGCGKSARARTRNRTRRAPRRSGGTRTRRRSFARRALRSTTTSSSPRRRRSTPTPTLTPTPTPRRRRRPTPRDAADARSGRSTASTRP